MTPSRRRYPRMPLKMDWGRAQPLLGAQAHWPNHEAVPIFDLSYSGASLGLPVRVALNVGEEVELNFSWPETKSIPIRGRVIWLGEQSLGVEFGALDYESRLAMQAFLQDRMIGFHMRRVERSFYSEAGDFTDWYHGPQNSNVFLWVNLPHDRLERARIEFDTEVIEYAAGVGLTPMGGGEAEDGKLFRRALLVLSQIPAPPKEIKVLIEELAKKW